LQNAGLNNPYCEPAEYAITYTLNSGTQASSGVPTKYTYGTGATISGIPTRADYVFSGWCTDSGLTTCSMTQVVSPTTTGAQTFYANWTQCTACVKGTGAATCSLSVSNNMCSYAGTCSAGYASPIATGHTINCSLESDWTITYKLCPGTDTNNCGAVNDADNPPSYNAETPSFSFKSPVYTGHTFAGWYRESTYVTAITGISKGNDTGKITVYAKWTPQIYTVNLDHQGATVSGTPGVVYLKYNTGWYSNAAGTTDIVNMTKLPTYTGYNFGGYFAQTGAGGIQAIDEDGKFLTNVNTLTMTTSTPITIYASWFAGSTTCNPGYYYTGNGSICDQCPANSYCPGGTKFATDSGNIQGLNACPEGGISTVGNDDPQNCYKTGLSYVSSTGYASGTQTCYYGTNAYDRACRDITVTSCIAGYYHASGTDCTVAGIGYYSEDRLTTRSACPNGGTNTITTSDSVFDCLKANLNTYVANNGKGTQTCKYTSGTGTSAIYNSSCSDEVITECNAGYWLNAAVTTKDCSGVGYGYYSPALSVSRSICEDSGQTDTEFSTSSGQCYKANMPYVSPTGRGTGYRICYYTSGTGTGAVYDANCETATITKCVAGYYRADPSAQDCIAVGTTYFSPVDDIDRTSCPNGGITHTTTSISMSDCFKTGLPYTSATGNGSGTQTCSYTSGTGASAIYNTGCTDKVINECKKGYYYVSGTDCTEVGYGYYSDDTSKNRTQCAREGATSTTTSTSNQDCYLSGLTYTANYGSGTQRCFYSSGSGATAVYNRSCDTKLIDKCRAGYWREIPSDTDCTPVGYDYYSPEEVITRSSCEDGGKTDTDTSTSSGQCYKAGMPYIATYGRGVRICYYTGGVGAAAIYDANCQTATITECDAGYYRKDSAAQDCIVSGIGYYSPNLDINRTKCEKDGLTLTTTSSAAAQCYLDGLSCNITNGFGEQTCNYSSGTGSSAVYGLNCTTCLVVDCSPGFSLVGNTCIACPENNVCDNGEQKTCASFGDGTYIYSDAGTTSTSGCYKHCALGTNAATMKGRDYYTGTDTCEIETCAAGYSLQSGVCVVCPAGSFCDGTGGGGDGSQSCSTLGDGSWDMSEPNATSKNDCYKNCPEYSVAYGTAIPDNETEYYPNTCTYSCLSETGNLGVIQGGTCVEESCKNTYEMIGGLCMPCNRPNALSYSQNGNCEIETCVMGYHPNGQRCAENVVECTAPNAEEAYQTWDASKKAFGICTIKTCAAGYHISSNACVIDEHECVVENGTGYKEWDTAKNKWGECIVTYCKPGYTFDPSETNELTKPCGQCKNKFSVLGELSVSSYTSGCDIAACMYQGELYNLEGNECVPICDVNGYEDETGTMKWNPATKKCVRQCKEGFTPW
jgi:uncharacterized repeat protein (TIGR02543 family)